ncbi:NADH-ubiquinone oxidoreductase-like protein 3 [Elsinoe australis]|uniref:NADH-ubiquinone oxidoreductase-like protein 3 n=1 Tax=Elsinoe australis TaxID=40998 RepID=A0A4U7B9J9_9PEZI|nr:NADH-ubiquinone oxidoreductase-like protein 3 [Elsinoe australis]
MQSLRRVPVQAKSTLRSAIRQQPRRYAHDSHGSHDAHSAPENESFGRGFFIALAAVPLSIAVYKFTASGGPDNKPLFTRMIESYYTKEETWDRRNDLHTQAVELAGNDRALFFNGDFSRSRYVEMRFPEAMNTGSPFNVPAGHGSGNIDAAIAKFEKQNYEENERKVQNLRDNNIRGEKPLQPRIVESKGPQ